MNKIKKDHRKGGPKKEYRNVTTFLLLLECLPNAKDLKFICIESHISTYK